MNTTHAGFIQFEKKEEATVGMRYERAVAVAPKLIERTTKSVPQQLGDGYFVATAADGTQFTIRLGRVASDTRLRIESVVSNDGPGWFLALLMIVVAVAAVLAGLVTYQARHGIAPTLALLPVIVVLMVASVIAAVVSGRRFTKQRDERLLARDLSVHALVRAFEDASVEKAVAGNYRVAPGIEPEAVDESIEEQDESARTARAVR
jgi:hypothetical protein